MATKLEGGGGTKNDFFAASLGYKYSFHLGCVVRFSEKVKSNKLTIREIDKKRHREIYFT